MPPRFRELVESEEYKDQLEKLGGAEALDEPLRGALWSLVVMPEVWPVIPGYTRIRLAFTEPTINDEAVIAAVKIWFEILDADRVLLLYLDIAEE